MAAFQSAVPRHSSSRPYSFPVTGHVDDQPAPARTLVQPSGQTADRAVTVVGPLALGIAVVNDHSKARPGASHRVLEHLEVSVGVPRRKDRSLADMGVDANRLAGLVVDKRNGRILDQLRGAAHHRVTRLSGTADDLLRRNTVQFLGDRTEEMQSTAGDDVDRKLLGA